MVVSNSFEGIRGAVPGRDRPLRFVANPASRSYGDYTGQIWAINTIVDQFDKRSLTILVKDDMDFKLGMLRLMVPVERIVALPAKQLAPTLEKIGRAHV